MAAQFEDLPLIVSIIGAAVVLVLFELVLPVVMANIGQNSSTHFNYASLFTPLVRLLGVFLAVAILLFGLKGAIRRVIDGMLAARHSRKVFERAIARPGTLSVTWSQLEDLVGRLGGWLLEHLTRWERDRLSDLKLGWLDFDRERIDENVA